MRDSISEAWDRANRQLGPSFNFESGILESLRRDQERQKSFFGIQEDGISAFRREVDFATRSIDSVFGGSPSNIDRLTFRIAEDLDQFRRMSKHIDREVDAGRRTVDRFREMASLGIVKSDLRSALDHFKQSSFSVSRSLQAASQPYVESAIFKLQRDLDKHVRSYVHSLSSLDWGEGATAAAVFSREFSAFNGCLATALDEHTESPVFFATEGSEDQWSALDGIEDRLTELVKGDERLFVQGITESSLEHLTSDDFKELEELRQEYLAGIGRRMQTRASSSLILDFFAFLQRRLNRTTRPPVRACLRALIKHYYLLILLPVVAVIAAAQVDTYHRYRLGVEAFREMRHQRNGIARVTLPNAVVRSDCKVNVVTRSELFETVDVTAGTCVTVVGKSGKSYEIMWVDNDVKLRSWISSSYLRFPKRS